MPPVVAEFADSPHGLVLITGPAGNGKSTTLASMIDYINRNRAAHIVCIEDPLEYVHTSRMSVIEQVEVLDDTPSFDAAMRSVFRQNPDIVMVGEMRDLETIRLALTLAETGHLIFATLHTHDTTNALNRIGSVFPAHEQQQIYSMIQTGGRTGMCTMNDSLKRLVDEGLIESERAIKRSPRPKELIQTFGAAANKRVK